MMIMNAFLQKFFVRRRAIGFGIESVTDLGSSGGV